MLKIAYEFAVDKIPKYFEDEQAKVISNILYNADFGNLATKVQFLGSGFNNKILKPFDNFLDLEDDSHYLILISTNLGLI